MAQEEMWGSRDRTYSAWHRRKSIGRYVGIEEAQTLAMIDLDASLYVEYDDKTKEPLALIETARDTGQQFKTATVTRNLARRCTEVMTPAAVVLYRPYAAPNPADSNWPDIELFRVQRIWPEPKTPWKEYKPEEWAQALIRLRQLGAQSLDKWLVESGYFGPTPVMQSATA